MQVAGQRGVDGSHVLEHAAKGRHLEIDIVEAKTASAALPALFRQRNVTWAFVMQCLAGRHGPPARLLVAKEVLECEAILV